MDSIVIKNCGCKGVRTCLFCEEGKGHITKDRVIEKETLEYTYCPHCNLCWSAKSSDDDGPILVYLGGLMLIPDFLNEKEETSVVSAIDGIEWMPSQSGRRKQDFGPKVNFKKKKGKVGNFKGFPDFSKPLIQKFQHYKELADFEPVELCHLDYCPERGSAIEPHIDDTWIWGERLVTVNLASPAVLTLTPTDFETCTCSAYCEENLLNSNRKDKYPCNHISFCSISSDAELEGKQQTFFHSEPIKDACGYRQKLVQNSRKIEIHVVMPPRSLLVLAGCSRHNWFHEIKRQHIKSRRLAMTFRELAANFMQGDKEKQLRIDLLTLGKTFYDCKI